jgi:hypothetical protein
MALCGRNVLTEWWFNQWSGKVHWRVYCMCVCVCVCVCVSSDKTDVAGCLNTITWILPQLGHNCFLQNHCQPVISLIISSSIEIHRAILLTTWEDEQTDAVCLLCLDFIYIFQGIQIIRKAKHGSGFQQEHDCKSVGEMYNYTWLLLFCIVLKIKREDRFKIKCLLVIIIQLIYITKFCILMTPCCITHVTV